MTGLFCPCAERKVFLFVIRSHDQPVVCFKPVVDAGNNALYAWFSNDSGMDGQCNTDCFSRFSSLMDRIQV